MNWTRSCFEIDGLGTYEGYHRGDDWNGFACPVFEKDEAERIAADFRAQVSPDGPFEASFDPDTDAFLFRDPADDPNEGPLCFQAHTIEIDGEAKHVYTIGTRYWTWIAQSAFG